MELKMQTRIVTGTYGTSYYNEIDEDTPRVKRAKAGRPAKEPAPVYNTMNDLFGRVPNTIPAGAKGRVVVGSAGMKAVYANDEVEI
jgi:hypothetical protein